MGQLPAKESSSSSSHRHHPSDPSSASANNSTFPFASSSSHPQFPSTSSNKPALPPLNLPSSFDGGKFEPQGVYPSAAQDYNHRIVHLAILNRKLAPFYKGSDDEDTYQDKEENNECPICFLYYPSPLNLSRCCSQPICTECFVQIKRADPDHTNPPSTEPAACPFCMQEEFGITYIPPLSIREKLASEKSGKKINTNDIPTSTSSSIGIDGELSSGSAVLDEETGNHDNISTPTSPDGGKDSVKEKMRRKSFGPNDPEVVTIDQIRPDFMDKLHLAQAAIARRANRRLIMRQVGDRLIPIGVTSGRMGAELNSRSEGPGGAIILREGERWGRIPGSSGMGGIQSISDVAASLANLGGGMAAPAASSNSASRRGGNGESERERGGTRRRAELERYLQGLGQGADVEEMMMMEAMRLSLLEHEEQQRKQAEAEKAEKAAKAASEQNSTTSSTAAAPSSESQVAGPSSSTIESESSKPTSSSKPTPPLPRTSSASSPGGSYLKSTPQTTTSSVAATASPQQPASTSSKRENPAPTSTSTSSSAPPTSTSFNFLSSNTMAELAELIDEGNESRVTSSPQTRTGGDDEAISSPSSPSQVVEVPTSVSHSKSGSISAPAATSGSGSGFTFPLNQNQTSSGTNSPSNSQFGGASSPPPSTSRSPHPPSSPSFTTRRLNPNNPFRRGNQSGNNSPNHSRQNSNLSNGVDLMD